MPASSTPKSSPAPIRERFNPRLIPALYNNFRNSLDALLELIDNAVDDRIESQPLTVEITYRRGVLSIGNRGGRGMGLAELETFLDWGGGDKRGKLGRYGQGGKAAMGYLGRSWEIRCKRQGEREAFRIVENDWHDRRMGLKTYTPDRMKDEDARGVVALRIWNLNRKPSLHQLVSRLGDLYKPLVLMRRVIFRINGRTVSPTPIPIAAHSIVPMVIPVLPTFGCPLCAPLRSSIWTGRCLRCGVTFRIAGWVGRLEPDSGIRGGLRCFSFGRMIATHEYFGHPDVLKSPSMSLLYGEVLFDFVPMILNKTDYQRDSLAWAAVHDAVHLQIGPVVDSVLSRDAEEEIPRTEIEQADQALRLIRRVLRSVSDPRPAALGLSGDEALAMRSPARKLSRCHTRPNEGVKEPTCFTRAYSRSGGFLQIELKALDPGLRAAVVDCGGHRVLVVNREFPAYKLAGSSLAYLLETACLELVKHEGTGEESAIELIDRAAHLLSESSSLALNTRRRSHRLKNL